MKFSKLNKPSSIVDISVIPYKIDWNPAREVSRPQARVKKFLKPYWKNDFVLEELVIPGSRLRCDIVNISKHIIVEVSPIQHQEFNKFFHGTKAGYLQSIKRDMEKFQWAEDNEFTMVEIFQADLDKELTKEWFEKTYGVIL